MIKPLDKGIEEEKKYRERKLGNIRSTRHVCILSPHEQVASHCRGDGARSRLNCTREARHRMLFEFIDLEKRAVEMWGRRCGGALSCLFCWKSLCKLCARMCFAGETGDGPCLLQGSHMR